MEFNLNFQETKTKDVPKQLFSNNLGTALNDYASNIKILSLDCFDTIIWRKTTTPEGVFFTAQHKPLFKKHGIDPYLRITSEKKARIKKYYNENTSEVTLKDIFYEVDKDFSEEIIDTLSKEELSAEMENCYALPSAIDLIHQANKHGINVVIVSDTYFCEQALRALLKSCLPIQTYQMINHVFCSSDYKKSKQNGIFKDVLTQLNCNASDIWHIGDNYHSDYISAQQNGIMSTHLKQFQCDNTSTLFRLSNYAAGFLNPNIGDTKPHTNPFSATIALSKSPLLNPEYQIGYLSLGPIFYAFSTYIKHEVEKLKIQGKTPKVLFLLRDGYLPALAFETLTGDTINSHKVYISRFSAIAASFETKDDIDDYLYQYANPEIFKAVCKQLLIPQNEAEQISNAALQSTNPSKSFIDIIHEKDRLNSIIKNSAQYCDRLYQYLKKQIDIKAGDTLIFVDLGYTGTAQKKLAPVFKRKYNVDIISRFLIACYIKPNDNSRSGLIDSSWCDDRAYSAIITFISLFEKLCSKNGGSVINYTQDGNPEFSDIKSSDKNYPKIALIQEKTQEFIRDVILFCKKSKVTFDISLLRDTALTELGRLLFFSTQIEIDHLKSIEYDIDMGSSDLIPVFDEEKGLKSLKRRGLLFVDKNRNSYRTNYPSELRYASIELSTMLLMQERLKFDLRLTDISLRRESIPLIIMQNGQGNNTAIDAIPTYDGYYSLSIPLGYNEFQIGVKFGLKYTWVQIEAIEIIPANLIYTSTETQFIIDAKNKIYLEDMTKENKDLYQCNSKSGLLVFMGGPDLSTEKQVLHIVFRPLSYI